jgi:hypothetical protein
VQQSSQHRRRHNAFQETTNRTARANIHRADFQHGMGGAGLLVQINVVDSDNFAAMDVDNLLIEQITAEQEQALRSIRLGPARNRAVRAQAVVEGSHGTEGQHTVA